MAYSAVPIVATGDLWTAANHNTYIRDNFAAGVPDIFTTKGDLAVASAADVANRLGVGTNGQMLIADSAQTLGIKWSSLPTIFPTARAYLSSSQSIPNNADTLIQYGNESFDSAGAFTTGASAKFTAPTTGYYLVLAAALFTSDAWTAGKYAALLLYKNGALVSQIGYTLVEVLGTIQITIVGSDIISLAAGDYIDVRCYQNSGGARGIGGGSSYTFAAFARVA